MEEEEFQTLIEKAQAQAVALQETLNELYEKAPELRDWVLLTSARDLLEEIIPELTY